MQKPGAFGLSRDAPNGRATGVFRRGSRRTEAAKWRDEAE